METRRSVWAEMTFLKVLFFWLIVPVIVAAVVAKHYRVTILDKTIVVKSGVFNKENSEYAVAGITQITVSQSFFGRIFHYGTVMISLAGNKNVSLEGIINPYGVKKFIEDKLLQTAKATHMLVN